MSAARSGQVITFYSYKGGTGRSMALANVACLLVQRQSARRVLMVDWDLEAPGLHRYFQAALGGLASPEGEERIQLAPGLLDLLWAARERFGVAPVSPKEQAGPPAGPGPDPVEVLENLDLEHYLLPVQVPNADPSSLWLLKAGCFDSEYSRKVNTMPWEALYYRAPGFFRALADRFAAAFDYVLIDSRTGLTDISGICTMLFPEKLVTVFTPNRQSLEGVLDLATRAIEYRQGSDDLRPLVIFPLPSRIDNNETDLRHRWRKDPALGYEPQFERLFKSLYGLDECPLEPYFDVAQIPHASRYAYGEQIAVLEERVEDVLSLAPYYAHFTDRLVSEAEPWEDPSKVAAAPGAGDPSAIVDELMSRLPEAAQSVLRGALTRLVRPAGEQEGQDSLLLYPTSELDPEARSMLERLQNLHVVTIRNDPTSSVETVQIAGEELFRSWRTLQEWIDRDREFLTWRESLRARVLASRGSGATEQLLSGSRLFDAERLARERPSELSKSEHEYLRACRQAYDLKLASTLASAATSEMVRGSAADSISRSVLLAAESVRRVHTLEGDQALRDALATLASPIATLQHEGPIRWLGTRQDHDAVATAVGAGLCLWRKPYVEGDPIGARFESAILAVAMNRTGERLAVCDDKGRSYVLNPGSSPALIESMPAGEAWLEFDNTDRLVALQNGAGDFYLIDPVSRKARRIFSAGAPIQFCRSSVDRRWVCFAAQDRKECFIWDASNTDKIDVLPLDGPCTMAGFSPSGRYLATASVDNVVNVWDRAAKKLEASFRHTEKIDRLILGPGDLSVVTLSGGRTAQIFPIRVKAANWRVRSDVAVEAVAASADSGLLALAGADNVVRIFEFVSGREVLRADHGARIRIIRFMADGTRLVTAGADNAVRIWDVRGQREHTRLAHDGYVWDIGFSPDRSRIITAGSDGHAHLWNADSGDEVAQLEADAHLVTSAAFSPAGDKIAVSSNKGRVRVYEAATAEALSIFEHGDNATSVAFSPDGQSLVTSSWDRSVRVWEPASGRQLAEFRHPDLVWHAQVSPDGRSIASACQDGGARLWNFQGALFARLTHPNAVKAVAFHPEGKWVATACEDGVARIFDEARQQRFQFSHPPTITVVAFSPDGEFLATGGADDCARIWRIASGAQISQIKHEGEVNWLTFSPDGKYLATASGDNAARLWLWRADDLIAEARRRVRRSLTKEEWMQYLPDEPYPQLSASA